MVYVELRMTMPDGDDCTIRVEAGTAVEAAELVMQARTKILKEIEKEVK